MNLKELAKQALRECRREEEESDLHQKAQIEWECKEELIYLGSQVDEMRKLIEDLSNWNSALEAQVANLKWLIGDLQISTCDTVGKRLKPIIK